MYDEAITLTIAAITVRSRHFRNQVVTLTAIAAPLFVLAVVTGQVLPLVGLLALLPTVGLFVWIDVCTVSQWRSKLFRIWAEGRINFHAFCVAMRAHPNLPKPTLSGMLDLLGSDQFWREECRATRATRQVVASITVLNDAREGELLAGKVSAVALVILACCWSHAMQNWFPFCGLVGIILLPWYQLHLLRLIQSQSVEAVHRATSNPEFDRSAFQQLIENLPHTSSRIPTTLNEKTSGSASAHLPQFDDRAG